MSGGKKCHRNFIAESYLLRDNIFRLDYATSRLSLHIRKHTLNEEESRSEAGAVRTSRITILSSSG